MLVNDIMHFAIDMKVGQKYLVDVPDIYPVVVKVDEDFNLIIIMSPDGREVDTFITDQFNIRDLACAKYVKMEG